MYTKKGARGTEVIPNIAFWKEFPFLIKVTSYMPTNIVFLLLHILLLFYRMECCSL